MDAGVFVAVLKGEYALGSGVERNHVLNDLFALPVSKIDDEFGEVIMRFVVGDSRTQFDGDGDNDGAVGGVLLGGGVPRGDAGEWVDGTSGGAEEKSFAIGADGKKFDSSGGRCLEGNSFRSRSGRGVGGQRGPEEAGTAGLGAQEQEPGAIVSEAWVVLAGRGV